MCVCAGIWTCCWGYSYGFKESNNSSINHCDDFHVSWRLFCSSKHIPVQKPHILTYISVLTYIYISPILQKVPDFIVWLRYLSFNYHTYKLLLKVQYGHMIHSVNGIEIDNGVKEVSVLAAMIFGYRFLAYLSLRRMKLGS